MRLNRCFYCRCRVAVRRRVANLSRLSRCRVSKGEHKGADPFAAKGCRFQLDSNAVICSCRRVAHALQIEAAKAEALSRLPPEAAEFLRRRGRPRSAAGTAAASVGFSAAAASAARGAPQQQAAAPAVSAPQLGTQLPVSGTNPASATRQQWQQDDQGRMPAAGSTAAARRRRPMHTDDGAAAAGQAPPEAAVARLRYGVGGQPAGFAPPSASVAPAASDVLQRDPLR